MDHPNICRLFETFHDRIYIHLVMSPCSGMSLRSFVESRKLLESELAKYARVMISVVLYLHSQKLQHRGLRLTSFVFETAAAGGGGSERRCDIETLRPRRRRKVRFDKTWGNVRGHSRGHGVGTPGDMRGNIGNMRTSRKHIMWEYVGT